ncbi:acyl-CoA dehydrogenase family protein [Enterovirga sp. CN4-39]|uniref:acyl-CoA dehydrogenase family protein n=1 Tax=Enterovirga sp. CN4-39 TaxID=3400910 RepID=UPI003C075556
MADVSPRETEEELELLVRTVRSFVDRSLAPHEAAVDEADEIEPALMAKLRQEALSLGLYGYNMPAEIGGPGLSRVAIAAIDEAMGHTSMALGEAIGHLPGSIRFANDAQREWFVGPLMRAETTVAYALTEPDAGSDLNALRTRATRVEGGWRIDGAKHFISHAETADHTIVLAVTDKDASLKQRLGTFIVKRGSPGFTIERRFRKLGWRGYPLSALSFDECFVPDSHVLGEPGNGFAIMMATINNDRLFVACRCVGMAQHLMDLVLPYVRERKTFGKRLGEHQAIQFMLADSDVELQAGRLLCRQAAELADAGHPDTRIAASRAKLYCSEMAGRVADRVLQIFGGAGFMTDLPVERIFRDVRGLRIGEGTSEMQRLQIARNLVG